MNFLRRGIKIWFTLFLIMAAFGAANAIAAKAERQEVRQACKDDFKTFCSEVQPGGGRLIACLRQNFENLSPGCQRALQAAKGQRKAPSPAQ